MPLRAFLGGHGKSPCTPGQRIAPWEDSLAERGNVGAILWKSQIFRVAFRR